MTLQEHFNGFLNNGGIPYERRLLTKHSARLLSILDGGNPPPYELEIQPSAYCNAHCLHCFGRDYGKCEEKLYERENMENVIDQVLNFKTNGFQVDTVKFCGSTGEPLVNSQTIYAIDRLYKKKALRFFTNGILLGKNKENFDYLNSISKVNILNLSLDAGTTETLWNLKPGAKKEGVSLEDILDAVKRIRGLSDSRGEKMDIDVGYVISNANYKDIIEAAKKVRQSGASIIGYRIDLTDRTVSEQHGEEINSMLFDAKIHEDEHFRVIPIYSETQIESTDSACFSSRESSLKCFVSRLWSCIGPNGNLYSCGHVVENGSESYGNIFDQDISVVWNSEQRKKVIANLPGKMCNICSPSSIRTNGLMTFFDDIGIENAQGLIESFSV